MPKNWVALSLLVFSVSLGIDQARGDDQADLCDSARTHDMLECAQGEFEAENKKLNNLYKKLRHKAGRGSKTEEALMKAQKTWLSFRDATCQYEALAYEGGTLYGAVAISCQTEQTRRRNEVLEGYLSCTSNDCP